MGGNISASFPVTRVRIQWSILTWDRVKRILTEQLCRQLLVQLRFIANLVTLWSHVRRLETVAKYATNQHIFRVKHMYDYNFTKYFTVDVVCIRIVVNRIYFSSCTGANTENVLTRIPTYRQNVMNFMKFRNSNITRANGCAADVKNSIGIQLVGIEKNRSQIETRIHSRTTHCTRNWIENA